MICLYGYLSALLQSSANSETARTLKFSVTQPTNVQVIQTVTYLKSAGHKTRCLVMGLSVPALVAATSLARTPTSISINLFCVCLKYMGPFIAMWMKKGFCGK